MQFRVGIHGVHELDLPGIALMGRTDPKQMSAAIAEFVHIDSSSSRINALSSGHSILATVIFRRSASALSARTCHW